MIRKSSLLNLLLAVSCFSLGRAAETDESLPKFDPIPMLSFEESVKTFQLPEGYHLELVVGDPVIQEPVVCAFDGNGRMFVAEMRTYMQDADATGEQEPTSCVSMHEDTNGDGKMDKHSIFIDKLLLPRQILPLDDRLLVQETNTLDIFSYRDTDGDGVADEKTLFYKGGDRGGNMEHQPSGLIWSMDNWLYTTYNAYRLRYNPDGLALKEPTAPNGGQWGLTQDNHGKPWFVNAGGELGPLNFQQPIVYGQFNVSDQYTIAYREVFPLVGIPDVQGGEIRFRPEEKTLNHFTATCGEEIFRGDRLPEDLRGDLLFSEPVGRLIRRSKVEVKEGVTYLKNAYDKDEFIRSTDPNFRAVNMVTAPDGCLYIVDMYRGIIQQGNWTKPGSYLRGVIDQYQFEKNIGHGRIYRLVHDDFERGPRPNMLNESPAEWVAHLEHPNGWWRDTAQKLLILKGDQSVAPALASLAGSSENYLTRMHALWTLEGLGAATPEIIEAAGKDPHPQVRRAAIRVSETLLKSGDDSLTEMVRTLAKDADADVAVQALLTAKLLKWKDHKELIETTMASNRTRGVQEFGKQMLTGGQATQKKLTPHQLSQYKKGEAIYGALCFACHGADGKGTPLPGTGTTLAPSFVDSPILSGHRDMAIKVVMHGLTGPINGKTYPGEMISMESNGDEWVADVLSYIRNSFGNSLGFLSTEEVSRVRAANPSRKAPWTEEELLASVPQTLGGKSKWKLTASHGSRDLKNCVDGDLKTRWTTGKSMSNGMWLQVELPEEALVSGLKLDAASSRNDYPRGYKIETSEDGENWSIKIKNANGTSAITEIDFEESPAKFIKITQTGKHSLYWSIHDLEILGKTAAP
ncbi:discoidin domain-containing protein [Verrucomicrobiales bacterium BCK34]|nr:discoidin domain-containing protein [Verrucomicrobiales bacterium BCK34]